MRERQRRRPVLAARVPRSIYDGVVKAAKIKGITPGHEFVRRAAIGMFEEKCPVCGQRLLIDKCKDWRTTHSAKSLSHVKQSCFTRAER